MGLAGQGAAGSSRKVGVVVWEGVVDGGSLGPAERRSIHTDRTQGMALVTHQALFSYVIDLLLVMPSQEPNEIHRRKLEILLLHIHRASVKAQSTTRAGIDLRLSHTFPGMVWLDPGVTQQDPKHLSQDVHVAAERHSRKEKPQADRICPPSRHEPEFVAKDQMPEMIDRDRQETSSAEVGGETLRQKP